MIDKASNFKDSVKIIWDLLGNNKKKFFFATFLTFIGNLNIVILPFFIGLIVDFFVEYNQGDSLTPFYTYCFVVSFLFIIIIFIRIHGKRIGAGVAIETKYRARMKFFNLFMNYSLTWHSKENIGSKIQRVNAATDAIRGQIRLVTHSLMLAVVSVFGIPLAVFFLNPSYSLFFVGYYAIMGFVLYYYIGRVIKTHLQYNIVREKGSGKYFEALNTISSIKTSGAKDTVTGHINQSESMIRDGALVVRDIHQEMVRVIQVINGVSLGVFLLLVGTGIVNDIITVGLIATYFSYFRSAMGKIFDVFGIILDSIRFQTEISRIRDFYFTKERKYFGSKYYPKNWKKMIFNAKNFSYTNLDVLKDLKFEIKRGSKVAFVGKTGSGKSTIAKILLGLYELKKGKIRFDDMNYYDIDHDDLMKNLTVVSQDIEILNVSLKDNIAMLNKKTKIDEAIKIAKLEGVIEKLPQGVDTLIGEKGYRLSGGERQRVGIARALCKNTDIIILDEATSSLDAKTEKEIIDMLYEIKDKTFIIIAHRLSTIKSVDKVLVVKNGSIVESGSFNELIRQKGVFANLYKYQK